MKEATQSQIHITCTDKKWDNWLYRKTNLILV